MDLYYSNLHSDGSKGMVDFFDKGKKVSCLVSFYGEVHSPNFKRKEWVDKFMLDSGAFSAKQQNTSIDINELIAYIKAHEDMFDWMVSLDVIGNAEASYKNYKIMQKEGIKCIPVYHMGEDMKWLYRYADNTDYIGLGGLTRNIITRDPFFKKVFTAFPDPNKVGFHGFGVGDEKLFLKYPWRSCDSSAMHILARFGGILVPAIKENTCIKVCINLSLSHKRIEWATTMKLDRVKEYIASVGADFEIASKSTPEGKKERCKISIATLEEIRKHTPTYYKSPIKYLGF